MAGKKAPDIPPFHPPSWKPPVTQKENTEDEIDEFLDWNSPTTGLSPEENLYSAFFVRGILDAIGFVSYQDSSSVWGPHEQVMALRWIHSDSTAPFSLNYTCDVLGLSAERIRFLIPLDYRPDPAKMEELKGTLWVKRPDAWNLKNKKKKECSE